MRRVSRMLPCSRAVVGPDIETSARLWLECYQQGVVTHSLPFLWGVWGTALVLCGPGRGRKSIPGAGRTTWRAELWCHRVKRLLFLLSLLSPFCPSQPVSGKHSGINAAWDRKQIEREEGTVCFRNPPAQGLPYPGRPTHKSGPLRLVFLPSGGCCCWDECPSVPGKARNQGTGLFCTVMQTALGPSFSGLC